MSYWNAFARKYPGIPVLRLEGGSIFNFGVAEGPVVNRWMLEGTAKSGLDAVNLTAWDLPVWQELGDLAASGLIPREQLALPIVSANLVARAANFPRVERYLIKEYSFGGKAVRVGITGVLADPDERISKRDFGFTEPQAAARQVVEELKPRTDYRILLTDTDIGKAISLSIGVPGFHMIVVGHNYHSLLDAQQIGDSLLVVPLNEGRAIGEVRLTLGGSTTPVPAEARAIPLDRTVPDDPVLGQLVRTAQADLETFRRK